MIEKKTKFLFAMNPAEIFDCLKAVNDEWNRSTQRQQRITPFHDTRSILVLYCEPNALSYVPRFHVENEALWRLALPCLRRIQEHYGAGYWCKMMFARLKAGGEVRPHFDKGWPLAFEHRFHWAIETNPRVSMRCGGEEFHFAKGQVWEINNRVEHSVRNLGSDDRIHMICDFVPELDESMPYWAAYAPDGLEYQFYSAVDKARRQWGSANNPLY